MTAGGLMFRSSEDGNLEAYNARNGELLWRFQTGTSGGGGSPVTYESNGQQYVAVSRGSAVWAFKLHGQIPEASAIRAEASEETFSGPVVDTGEIGTASLQRSLQEPGVRYFIDEYAFNPYRVRVTAGAKVLFVNNGNMRHEIVALDGSWGTGPLSPTQEAWVTFEAPGKYTYICKDHPWTYGEIIVAAGAPLQGQNQRPAYSGRSTSTEPLRRVSSGQEQFSKYCGDCHKQGLGEHSAAPTLLGGTFLLRWGNATVGELFEKIRTTMPQGEPGQLDRGTYLNITAYILRESGLSPHADEMENSPDVLYSMSVGQNR